MRLSDRLMAILLLLVGLACIGRTWLSLGRPRLGAVLDAHFHVADIGFVLAGILCLHGAWMFATGRLIAGTSREASVPSPLFGRNVEKRVEASRLRPAFIALPLLMVLALTVDGAGPLSKFLPDAPAEGKVATTPTKPEEIAIAPTPAPEPDPPPFLAPPELQAPPVIEVAAPPAAIIPAVPPATVAPLPEAPSVPTQADGHRDAVVWLAVSADGHSILSTSTDHTVKLWDVDGVRLIRTLGIHKDMARVGLFMPDGKTALTAGDDGEIVLRSLSDGAILHVFQSGENGGVNKIAISDNGKLAISGHSQGAVIIWDIEKKSVRHVMSGHDWSISSVAMSPGGKRAVSNSIDGTLKLWDVDTGRLLRTGHAHERGAYGAAFTADGKRLVTGSGDYTIKLWEVETGKQIRRYEGHAGTVYAIALSLDDKIILSGSLDRTARLWDLESGAEIAQFNSQTGSIYSVAFAADGSVLTGSNDRTIRHWAASGGDGDILFAGAPDAQ